DRVLTRLAEAAHEDEKCQLLGGFLGDGGLTRPRCAELLESLVRNLHRLRISTLDAFFAQIATSFGLELGLPPGWRIIEETADQRLRTEAIQAVLAGDGSEADEQDIRLLLSLLTKGEATRSISEQIRSQVNGLYGLFLETTDDAWNSLPRPTRLPQAKLEAALDALGSIELPDGSKLAATRDSDLATARAEDWGRFISVGIAGKVAAGEDTFSRKKLDADLLEVYHTLVSHAKAVLLGQLADQTEATRKLLVRFDGHYQRLKLLRRGLRFEDVTRSLGTSPLARQPDRLARRLDGRVAHLLLDEFQDTSLAQWNVLASFAAQVMAGGSFFCVGDAKQAIYGWRGGAAALFDTLEAEWQQLKAQSLARSFRSSPPVIATVNRVFGALEGSPLLSHCCDAVKAWKRAFEQHSTQHDKMRGYVRMISAPAAEEPTPQEETTLAFAAGEIARLAREAPGRSIGALVRDNNAVARLIYELRNQEVEASEEGGNPLTDSPAVVAVLSLLRIADHPGDRVARFHVASSPLGAIVGFTDYAHEAAAQRLSLGIRQSLLTRGYGGTLYHWARRLAEACDERDSNRLLQLVELADRYQPDATLRARDFIALVETQRIEDPSRADVRVMTIHQAKGLEFDIVVLPQLDKKLTGQTPPVVVGRPMPTAAIDRVCRYAKEELRQLLPPAMQAAFAQYSEQQIRESLCVLYVAMTRAVHALHLIIAPSRSNEKQVPKQFSGILRACLTEGERVAPCTTLFEEGDPTWHRKVQGSRQSSSEAPRRRSAAAGGHDSRGGMLALRESFRIELAPLAAQRRRGLERQNPSELARGAHVDLALRLQLDRVAATDRGTVFHAWFEQIEWLDDGPPDAAGLRAVAKKLGASADSIEAWLTDFLRALQRPAVRAALSRNRYSDQSSAPWSAEPGVVAEIASAGASLEVSRERDFAVRHADKLLTGTIDRLVLVRSRDGRPLAAEVVDFKTDAVAAQGAAGEAVLNEKYAPQLAAYRLGVSQFTGLAPQRVFTRLLFTESAESSS
ncbi:MAG TPA: UvrD-helicase domain-containing protein, partial [Pirellulales bacterium]|nr:UvrD-helicase domain-containing protein [Pirellulales bacterium]